MLTYCSSRQTVLSEARSWLIMTSFPLPLLSFHHLTTHAEQHKMGIVDKIKESIHPVRPPSPFPCFPSSSPGSVNLLAAKSPLEQHTNDPEDLERAKISAHDSHVAEEARADALIGSFHFPARPASLSSSVFWLHSPTREPRIRPP